MGIYLNPGNENFASTVRTGNYVDKTMMISIVNGLMDTDGKYICMSRPRRFGKTIAGNMLCAYYSKGCDSRELFRPYDIATKYDGFDEKLNKYNVICIDMNSEYQNTLDKRNLIRRLMQKIKNEISKCFPEVEQDPDDSLAELILKVYECYKETFIIIIDEYDVLVRERVAGDIFDDYLGFLNGLFKSNTLKPAISLAYLTGILPVVRDKVQSKLNNFDEYTMVGMGKFAEYAGFTGAEVESLCVKYGMDFEECRRWYDGYRQNGIDIYNPESVAKSMINKEYRNYWGKTSSYEAVSDMIRMNFEGTRDDVISLVAGGSVKVNAEKFLNKLDSFKNKDDIFTYLIHIGYLAYDSDTKTCRVPNGEIRQEWLNAIEDDSDYAATDRIVKESERLLEYTWEGDEEAVARALHNSHINVTSNRSFNNEDALQSAIYLCYIYALNKYTVVKEMTAGKGFADLTFIPFVPDIPAMIVELKRKSSPESAIEQIRRKEYFRSLDKYSGKVLFIGISYDPEDKTHSCRIERFAK